MQLSWEIFQYFVIIYLLTLCVRRRKFYLEIYLISFKKTQDSIKRRISCNVGHINNHTFDIGRVLVIKIDKQSIIFLNKFSYLLLIHSFDNVPLDMRPLMFYFMIRNLDHLRRMMEVNCKIMITYFKVSNSICTKI